MPCVIFPTSKKYSFPPSMHMSMPIFSPHSESEYLNTRSAFTSGASDFTTTAFRHLSSSKDFQLKRFECIRHHPPFETWAGRIAFSLATFDISPNFSRWASPTFVIIAISGDIISASSFIWPRPPTPASIIAHWFCLRSILVTVRGTPISLL